MAQTIRFVNLHGHSTFSHGDGHRTPAQHVARAAGLGYTGLALTEHGGVSSHYQLEQAASKAGIKAIFGLEAYTGPVGELAQRHKYHLTILAKDARGYRNLNQLVTRSWRDHYQHPTVSGENLRDNAEGLCVLSGCTGSLLACSIIGGKAIPKPNTRDGYDWDAARLVISRHAALLGADYFLEVQPFWELEDTCRINPAYELLSKEMNVPLVVTCDVHYPYPDDYVMQAVLHAVHRGKHTVEETMREWNYKVKMTLPVSDKDLHQRLVKTGLSRDAAWQAILNAEYIAEMCNVTLPKAERLRYPISAKDLKPW